MAKRTAKSHKGWWKRCIKNVSESGMAYSPERVCGALLRRKKAKEARGKKR